MAPKTPSLRALAEAAKSVVGGNKSPLDAFFAPGSDRLAELLAYLKRLKERGVMLTAVQVYFDLRQAYPALPVAGDSCRKWLTKNVPADLLPWK